MGIAGVGNEFGNGFWRGGRMRTDGMSWSAAMSPGEGLFVVAAAVVAGAVSVVWAGAAVAAGLVGASPPGGAVDAMRAIPRLVSIPSDPAGAWSHAVERAVMLPSAPVYWVVTGLVAFAAAVVLFGARILWRQLHPHRRRLGVDADARFASRRDLRPLLVRRPVPGRFVLGTWGRWLVATESNRWAPKPKRGWARWWGRLTGEIRPGRDGDVSSVAIVGPTRSGKTAECAIPGVLDWEGPAILLSVKRDLMDTTIQRRRALGQVRVFDPGGYLAQSPTSSHGPLPTELARWSPLRNADTATGAKQAGEALAAWTPQVGVEGGMSFWTTQGKLLFTGLLGAAALSGERSMADLAEWVFTMSMPGDGKATGCPPAAILDRALGSGDPVVQEAAEAAVMHLAAIWNKPDDKIKASVYSTAVTVCDPWLDPKVLAVTDLSTNTPSPADVVEGADGTDMAGGDGWVDLDWLLDTGADGSNANTLYLLVANDDYKRLAPVLAGLLSDLKSQAYQWEMHGRPLPAPLLMLIDEAGNMPLDWLPEVSSTCAGIGIQLVTVWQSLAQIHEAYGRRADVLLTNHATKLFFPAASDDSTLSYQSKIVGDEEIERRSWSNDLAGGTDRRSVSGQEQRDALVPYFLARLPNFGRALMVHSNTPPTQIAGRRWWTDRRLLRLASGTDPGRGEQRRRGTRTRRDARGPWEPTPGPTTLTDGAGGGSDDGRSGVAA